MKIKESGILSYIATDPKASILDWGCGEGDLLDNLKSLGCESVHRLDVEVIFAREDISIDSDTIAWLENRPLSYDVVILRESFYYVAKNQQARLWLACYNSLKSGGRIFVISFNGVLQSFNWILQKDLGIKLIPNEILLRNLARSAGFEEIELIGVTPSSRTFLGKFASFVFGVIRSTSYKFRYLLERGIDSQNPTLFTKQICLRAVRAK